MLNVMHRFATAAAAPVFLNISMMATLALAAFFPSPGHAAAWGVLISGFLQYFLLAGDVAVHGGLPRFAPLKLDDDVPRLLSRARAGDLGLDGHAGRAVCRYHHRDLSRRRRALGAVLCRPAQSTADRGDRHRDRHGVAAGNVAAVDGGRSRWRDGGAAPGVRFHAVVFGAVRGGVPDGAGRDHAGDVRARRVLQGRCRGRRRHARGLRDWADSVRADPQRGFDLFTPARIPRPRSRRRSPASLSMSH